MPSISRALSTVGSAILWVCAVVGVLTCAAWVATSAGWIKPLIVVSGSMEPEINKGDLLVSVPTPVEEIQTGDVVTLFNEQTQMLVTHRVVRIEPGADDEPWEIVMKGDANPIHDPEPYVAGLEVWTPAWQFAGVGESVSRLSNPGVVVPALVALGALLALSLMRGPERAHASVPRKTEPPQPANTESRP